MDELATWVEEAAALVALCNMRNMSNKGEYPWIHQRTEVAFTEACAPLPDAAAEWEPGKAGGTTTSYVR